MKLHIGVGLEPTFVFLVGVEVVEDDVKLAVRKVRGHAVHEVEKLDTAAPFCMRRNDLSGGDFERRKQCGRAMPLVVVALAGQGAAIGQLQIALRSHQDLRTARSILWLRRNRQTYWTSTSPSASASRGPVQRAKPSGGGLSSSFRIRLSVAFV